MKENREELDRLLEEMAEETPEMPADFHARWTKQIQEEQKAHKHSERTRQTRYILSAAALFVFLVGGTLITRGWNKRNQAVTAPAPQAKVMYSVETGGAALQADALQAAEEREEAAEVDKAAPMEEAPVMAAQMKEASGMAGNAMESAAEYAEEEEVFYEAAEVPAMEETATEDAATEEPAAEEAPAEEAVTEDRAEGATAADAAAAPANAAAKSAEAKPAETPKKENEFLSFMRDFANFSLKALGVLAVIAGLAAAVIAGRRYISKNNSKK